MAKVLLDAPVAAVAGAISKHQQVIYRMRNGRTHAYVIAHPNEQPPSETQKRNSSLFGQISKQAYAEMADMEKRAMWYIPDTYPIHSRHIPDTYVYPTNTPRISRVYSTNTPKRLPKC